MEDVMMFLYMESDKLSLHSITHSTTLSSTKPEGNQVLSSTSTFTTMFGCWPTLQ